MRLRYVGTCNGNVAKLVILALGSVLVFRSGPDAFRAKPDATDHGGQTLQTLQTANQRAGLSPIVLLGSAAASVVVVVMMKMVMMLVAWC